MPTKIEWVARPSTTPETWNVVGGCTKTSPGCANCYAIRQSWMKMHHPNPKTRELYEGTVHKVNGRLEWTGRINLASSERLEKPLRWRKPRTVFVCSMGDLFHEDVPMRDISRIFEVTFQARQHTFLMLTKRPGRALEFYQRAQRLDGWAFGYPNVWLGVTAENQETADERILILQYIPAAMRFVSCEPLLEKVDLRRYLGVGHPLSQHHPKWVIAGCESGPRRRSVEQEAFISLRDQCVAAGIPFFLKQMEVNGKVAKMPSLDGQVWDILPRIK